LQLFGDRTSVANECRLALRRSWERCARSGMRTDERVAFDPVTRSRLSELDDQFGDLARRAQPAMERLAQTEGAEGCVVLLTDPAGVILQATGDPLAMPQPLRTSSRRGVDLAERLIGSNALSVVAAEDQLSLVGLNEHYCEEIRGYFCAAAPILDPAGSRVGILDLTAYGYAPRLDALSLVAAHAAAIENTLFECDADHLLLRLRARADTFGSAMEGLLRVALGRGIVGANRAALAMLGRSRAELNALALETLSGYTLDELLRSDGRALGMRGAGGVDLALRVEAPAPARVRVPSTVPHIERRTPKFDHISFGEAELEAALRRSALAYERDLPVLLLGETGTGKEWVARALHDTGPTAQGPFVAVNCAAIPEGLIESELFGYAEGAFTGSRRGGMPGKLEAADGGTLFLDEIGDMPWSMQARLLRVLQDRQITRLGSHKTIVGRFRLICATHCDLKQMVQDKRFREDLYFRINGIQVQLPALRARTRLEAIVRGLADAEFARHYEGPDAYPQFEPGAWRALLSYSWPGNLRELQRVLALTAVMSAPGHRVTLDELPPDVRAASPESIAVRTPEPVRGDVESLTAVERRAIEAALAKHRGNISAVARALGVSRATVYRKLKAASGE
jgi:transcriptional regulator of acetoin/glycerol metabolism